MRKFYRAVSVIALLLFSAYLTNAYANDAEEAQKKLDQIRAEIEALKSDLKKNQQSKSSLESQLKNSEKDIESLREKVEKLKNKLETKSNDIKKYQKQSDDLQQEKISRSSRFEKQLIAHYKTPGNSQLKLLLSGIKPENVERYTRYNSLLNKKSQSDINTLKTTIDKTHRIEKKLLAESLALKKNRKLVEMEASILAEQRRKQEILLAQLGRSISSDESRLSGLRNDQKRLESLLAKLAATSKEKTDFGARRGKLRWPAQGKVLRAFGAPRASQRVRWEGMLIEAPGQKDIMAAHSGTVVFSEFLRGHGQLLIVDHGDGYMTLYANNEQLHKLVGERVRGGETIGLASLATEFRKPAVYFELRYRGKPQDPITWLARR